MNTNQIKLPSPSFISYLRGCVFTIVVIFASIILMLLICLDIVICFVFPFICKYNLLRRFSSYIAILLPRIVGIKIKLLGIENIPSSGAILLSKHMSMMETCVLATLPNTKTLLRDTLKFIPIWNIAMYYTGCIWIKRSGGVGSLLKMLSQVEKVVDDGKKILIFPEGTRVAYGKKSKMKLGIMQLYPKVTFVPVALNCGVLFGKRTQSPKFTGVVTIKIMPPIPPNINIKDARELAASLITTESDRLCAECVEKYIK
ncbi:MAG: 1-acyl-sn-glycerol-3-phosphate acyltransferase [Alphaproteobacteria bacterium]|nr:1-acyl-sn-glycerol-3-phosphate acyltransferase [Rickettsiales bacterium]